MTSFEIPKDVIEKLKKNKVYSVRGFWNGKEWYYEFKEIEK